MDRNNNLAENRSTGIRLFQEAYQQWASLSSFRRERTRNKNYTFGRQWDDMITVDGIRMTEREYIISEGNIPLQNNLLRRIVRNVLGVFRRQLVEKMDQWEGSQAHTAAANGLYELYSRTMEEFLISGIAIHRIRQGLNAGIPGVWHDMVSPDSFFFTTSACDTRGWDVDLIGQFHDVSFTEYCNAFVQTQEEYEMLLTLNPDRKPVRVAEIWRHEKVARMLVHDENRGAVVKMDERVWKSDRKLRHHTSRWILDDVWRYYFVTPDGSVLRQGDSPLPTGKHPYVFKCYPFLDGEIHSFVADIIDQQRYTNRLITMYDWIMRASAKGVLLMPEGAVDPENIQDVADQWSRFNGVIVYRPKTGQPDPKQVNGSAPNSGICELLDIQLKMLEDVSGVNGALQGNVTGTSVSGTLYNQQTQNSLNSLTDLLDTFASFISDCQTLSETLSAASDRNC